MPATTGHFPSLRTGAVTQYPSARRTQHSTQVLRFVDGSEQRWRERAQPERCWLIHLTMASEDELAAIETFFIAQQGAFGQFAFTDPWDGVTYDDCSFDEDSLRAHLFGDEWISTSLLIRCNTADQGGAFA